MSLVNRKSIRGEDEQESFFVSMTDIMVGLLFIFIILLVYFVTQVRIEVERNVTLQNEFSEGQGQLDRRSQMDLYRSYVGKQRSRLLGDLKSFFEKEGFENVEVDLSNGVLRFPEGVLFASGEFEFEEGTETALAVETLANAIAEVLPCSVLSDTGERYKARELCAPDRTFYPNIYNAFVEGLYIEGHTDSVPVNRDYGLQGDAKLNSNLKLSARRSANTYEKMIGQRPKILDFYGFSSNGRETIAQPVIAVSAYGDQRPISENATPVGQRANRRIDVRLVMFQPTGYDALKVMLDRIEGVVISSEEYLNAVE